MKNVTYILLLVGISIIIDSCSQKTERNLEIEVLKFSSEKYDDDIINGDNLDQFFNRKEGITKTKVILSFDDLNEFDTIIKMFRKGNKSANYSLGVGTYQYAIIYDNDTLYSNPTFKVWRKENNLIVVQSDKIENILMKYFE
ncbi:hypothetical protein POV27_18495 [Aureisphaera galaxeae]|uniref:hypothetical protein n=1 Tax=Aureisphaera galaxeae TaxID=1538023 RepID=UPI002350B88F|nr:hypothetical protein [Aureisphaera galaxeae]MDC8006048.1 hypothetical protein [Aureisphaera galaxeae]